MSPPPVRAPVIAGNWKMNKGPTEARTFFTAFTSSYESHEDRTIVFFPPALSFAAAAEALAARPDIGLGVQNVHWEKSGAFTGELSAPMAADAGAGYVLIGHSERRHVFGESDADVARKTAAVLAAGLVAVVCVGETLEQRQSGELEEVLQRQLTSALEHVENTANFMIAYEPVWAIGTGVNATPQDAAAAHTFLRGRLASRTSAQAAAAMPILYGGSVKPENAAELLAAENVGGLLVGGASLDPAGFARIAGVRVG